MDIIFNLAGVPFDGVHRVTLVISILGSGGSVVFVRVVVPVVMEELPPCVGEEMLQKLS
jgi:hypothetical protein